MQISQMNTDLLKFFISEDLRYLRENIFYFKHYRQKLISQYFFIRPPQADSLIS